MFPQATAFSFHDNHGTRIVLSDDKQTAERTAGSFDGIVMSRDHMVENTVYEVNNQSVTKIHFVVAMGVKSGVQSTAILRRVFESRPY